MSAEEPVLSLEDVEVHFSEETALMEAIPQSIKDRFGWNPNPVRAVDGVSLDIGENDVVAVVGESGSGKTTLGKAAIGLQQPTGGSVKYRGYDIWDVKRQQQIDDMQFSDIRRALQIIHQDPSAALNPYKTIMTSLKEPLRLWNADLTHADCRERIHSVFQEVGLTPVEEYETRYPHELSGGEQQRVVLLRAMLLDPDVILADEPVSKLDPSLRVDLMDLMLDLQDRLNTSFVYITHDLRTARYMASHADGKLAIMYLGRIVEVGPYDEVLDDPKHPYTKILKWATLNTHPDRAKENLEQPFPVRAHEPPDSGNIPSGCRFHPRCPKAREVCATESPQMYGTNGEEGHQAACYLEDQDHEYWNTDFLEEGGEIEIPE